MMCGALLFCYFYSVGFTDFNERTEMLLCGAIVGQIPYKAIKDLAIFC
jgi:hypothetical protein